MNNKEKKILIRNPKNSDANTATKPALPDNKNKED